MHVQSRSRSLRRGALAAVAAVGILAAGCTGRHRRFDTGGDAGPCGERRPGCDPGADREADTVTDGGDRRGHPGPGRRRQQGRGPDRRAWTPSGRKPCSRPRRARPGMSLSTPRTPSACTTSRSPRARGRAADLPVPALRLRRPHVRPAGASGRDLHVHLHPPPRDDARDRRGLLRRVRTLRLQHRPGPCSPRSPRPCGPRTRPGPRPSPLRAR